VALVAQLVTGSGFLNVDLVVRSRSSLAALREAFGERARVPDQGEPPRWLIVNVRDQPKSAEAAVRKLLVLLGTVPPRARRAWLGAGSRVFDVGIAAQAAGRPFEGVTFTSETLAAVARARAAIQITVYPPEDASGV